jgi:feruloyl esterase
MSSLRLVLLLSAVPLVQAQIAPPPGQSVAGPKLSCADLRSLTGYEFTVITAAMVQAGPNGPEYCRVTGQILPEIRFEVNLPGRWNRRFLMTGNGGFAGEDLDAPNRAGGRAGMMGSGFASAASNTGHDAKLEPGASFAQDRQKLLDYAFRSLHTTAETAKLIITAYYGAKPARSYFQACSTGGRQALMLAQRFPEDFDGIISNAPVLDFTGTMMRFTCTAQALAEAPIPSPKLALLSDRIYKLCDAKDGLEDGLIDDPRRCDFRPSRDLPKCPEGKDGPDCFTLAQIGALEKIYGPVMSNGKQIFPGWPVSGEVGWNPWIVRDGAPSTSAGMAESFLRYMAFPEKNAEYRISDFNVSKDPARMQWLHTVLDATDTDLSRFRGRGGKLLMTFGWADPALNAQMGVDYYESVVKRMGTATPGFFRLFMVPGMFHCGGGVGTSNFDTLTPLLNWVEKNEAPDRIAASKVVNGKVVRTRPLCPYPQTAKYQGSGSIDDVQSFTCAAPSPR